MSYPYQRVSNEELSEMIKTVTDLHKRKVIEDELYFELLKIVVFHMTRRMIEESLNESLDKPLSKVLSPDNLFEALA